MVKIPELIDFCFTHAPEGYAQDSMDHQHVKEMAKRSEERQYLTFTYGGHNGFSIRMPPKAIEIQFDLLNDRLEIRPFIEFIEKLRNYVKAPCQHHDQ